MSAHEKGPLSRVESGPTNEMNHLRKVDNITPDRVFRGFSHIFARLEERTSETRRLIAKVGRS